MNAPAPPPSAGHAPADVACLYPAEHHFRIVLRADEAAAEAALCAVLVNYEVTAPLMPANRSAGGRYCSMQVTVRLSGRDEHVRLDAALRAVRGVRILL